MNHPQMGSTNALPRGAADVRAAAAPVLDGLRVLVVDDEASIRELLGAMLGGCGAARDSGVVALREVACLRASPSTSVS